MALLSCYPFLDVNQQDKEGDMALMLAAQAGVRLLTLPSPNLLPPSWAAAPHFLYDVLPPQTPLSWVEGGFGSSSLLSRGAEICLWCSAGHVPLVSLLCRLLRGPGPGVPGPVGANSADEGCPCGTALNAWLPSSWQVHRAWTGIRVIQSLPQQTLSQMSQLQRGERWKWGINLG